MTRWPRWMVYGLFCGLMTLAHADAFPNRPLTMVVGFAQGGSTDVQARVLATVLSEQLRQPVTVLNVPGAGGGVAAAMIASSQDQGYVFQFGLSSTISLTPLMVDAPFSIDSFAYVAALSRSQAALVTSDRTGIKDWASMIRFLRENPGKVYATQLAQDRLLIQAIARTEGLNLRIVSTTGGAGSTPLLLSGEASLAYSGGSHTDHTDSGRIVVLASLDERRLLGYPDVPTLRELGYDLSLKSLRIVTVPVNTPKEQVAVLEAAMEAATRDPRFVDVTVGRIRQPIEFRQGHDVKAILQRQARDFARLAQELKAR